MKPKIVQSKFGSIQVEEQVYNHDILIRLDGSIVKRKKKLSKRKFGTSHKVSLGEMKYIFEEGASNLVIGTGQYGQVRLSRKAEEFLQRQACAILMAPTQQAIELWNESEPGSIAMFHVTC